MGKFLKWVLIILVVILVAGYFGVPALLGTDWAREKIRVAMADETGRDVELGAISFGWTSGLTVSDVRVGQKAGDSDADGPLFVLDGLSLSVGWKDLLDKKISVDDLTVKGPRIVIVRDKNGRLNIEDLLDRPSKPSETPDGERGKGPAVAATLQIEDGTILFIDQKLGTRVEASGIHMDATWNSGKLTLDSDFDLNGGAVTVKAAADLSKQPSPFTVDELKIDGATFSGDLATLAPFIPLMGDKPQDASGTLGFELKGLSAAGFDMESLKRTLTGSGSMSLAGGALVSGPVTQIYSALKAIGAGDLSALAAGGDSEALGINLLQSTFEIADGKVKTRDMNLDGAGIDLALTGWTSLDGQVDYKIRAADLDKLLASNAGIKKYVGDSGGLPLEFTGSLESPRIGVDVESALKGAAGQFIEEKLGEKIDEHLPGGLKDLLPGGR